MPQDSAGYEQTTVRDETPMAPPPKVRRRPLLWAVGIALIVLGALGAAYVTTAVSNTTEVLVLRKNVDRGQTLTAQDLTTAPIAANPALTPMKAGDLDKAVGKKAARDLNAGSLLTEDAIAAQVYPSSGQAVVGVALTPAQMPETGVMPGAAVTLVSTPRQQDQFNPNATGASFNATVIAVHTIKQSGDYVVDVTLPSSESTQLAQLVATTRIGLVVTGSK